MNKFKRVIVLLVCFVLLSNSLCITSFATEVSQSTNALGNTEVSEDGVLYEYDNEGNLLSEGYNFNNDYAVSTMSLKSKNYDWSPDNIDWGSFPSYIKACVYMPFNNINIPDDEYENYRNYDYYCAPLVVITTNGSTYTIRVGINTSLMYRESTGSCTFGFTAHMTLTDISPELYMATFKCSDNSVVSDWTYKDFSLWTDNGADLYYFPGSGFNHADKIDIYTYGVSGGTTQAVTAQRFYYGKDTSDYIYAVYKQSGRGILDMSNCGISPQFSSNADNAYISTFEPAAPTDYTVSGSTTFGMNSTILTGSSFIFHENLPYGLNSSVLSFTSHETNNTYHLVTDANADTHYFRNWTYSSNGKFTVTLVSSCPIYRIGYVANTGGLAGFGGVYGLTKCSSNFDASNLVHYNAKYYVDKGYYFYSYDVRVGGCSISISNNSTYLNIDDSLSFPHSYGTYPTADTLSQILQNEQNDLLQEGNETSKSIFDTLKSVLEYIKDLPSNIANSIKKFFTDLGDRISGFFENLSENISGYFDTLKNYLLYFQATKPEHNNPFAGILSGIKSFFDEQIADTDDFKDSLNDTFDNVSGYIETGSNVINKLLSGVPILNTVLIFFLVFAVVRKVVGR